MKRDDGEPHIDEVRVLVDAVEIYGHEGEYKFAVNLPISEIVKMKNIWVEQ